MKKFVNKINDKISIYYLVLFLLYFLAMCLPFANIVFGFTRPQTFWLTMSYYIRFDKFNIFKVFSIVITIIGTISVYFLYNTRKKYTNITSLTFLVVIPILSSVDMIIYITDIITESYYIEFHIGFYLMLLVLLVHTAFTILSLVYKVNISKEETLTATEKKIAQTKAKLEKDTRKINKKKLEILKATKEISATKAILAQEISKATLKEEPKVDDWTKDIDW